MGERPTTGTPASAIASRMPGTARIVPTDTTGLDGGKRITSASAIASSTPGAGLACSAPTGTIGLGRDGGPQPHPVLLEVDGLALARPTVDGDMGLDAVVGHRDEPHPGLPPVAQRLGDGAQRVARAEHLRPHDVRGEVAVAEPEPLRSDAVRRELLLDWKVSSVRPQPCSSLMPPPRVYITVSRSGQTFSPNRWMSSPVLPMTVMSASGAACLRPRRNRAPPIPPARTTMRMWTSLQAGIDNASAGRRARRRSRRPAACRQPVTTADGAQRAACIGISVRPGK